MHVIKIIRKFIEAKDSGFKKYFLLEKLVEDLHSYLNQEFKDYDFKCILYLLQKLLILMEENKKLM